MLGWGIWDTLDGRTIYPLKFFTTTFSSPFQGLMSPVVFNILRGQIIAERYRRKQVILELFKLVVSYQCRRLLLFHLLIEDNGQEMTITFPLQLEEHLQTCFVANKPCQLSTGLSFTYAGLQQKQQYYRINFLLI